MIVIYSVPWQFMVVSEHINLIISHFGKHCLELYSSLFILVLLICTDYLEKDYSFILFKSMEQFMNLCVIFVQGPC